MRRNKFNLSHYKLTSCDMGELIPIGAVEVLHGDRFQHSTSALIRVTPQQKPVMHPCSVHIHHFFVPNRLVWSGWEDFITGESATPPPTISGSSHVSGTLSDYLGIYDDPSTDFSALPVRAYNMIWNTYYRDQDIDSEVSEDTNEIQRVRWSKDYFTTARPWSQKGTAVTIPLGASANVAVDSATGGALGVYSTAQSDYQRLDSSGADLLLDSATVGSGNKLYADLSGATGADIREFREAFGIQRYQEARARYGSEYVDYLAYYGVNAGDARLRRPEYLGGGRQSISFSEVLATAEGTNTAVGDLAGHGLAAMRSNRYRRQFSEHGWVISVMFVRPKPIYVQGIPRKFTKTVKEDYYQRELQHVGAQEVLNRELYAPHSSPEDTFGYSTRYAEYFSEPSTVTAEFRDSTNYDWHFGRIFGSDPALNSTFLECSPTKRVFSEQSKHSLWVMANHSLVARRIVGRSTIGKLL